MNIFGARRTGKTTRLIELSAKHWQYIVVPFRQEVDRIAGMAREMGVDIPQPITLSEAKRPGALPYNRGVLVDQADVVLAQLLAPLPVAGAVYDLGESEIMTTPSENTILAYVAQCQSCGIEHRHVQFWKFKAEKDNRPSHWGRCPVTGEPILMNVV